MDTQADTTAVELGTAAGDEVPRPTNATYASTATTTAEPEEVKEIEDGNPVEDESSTEFADSFHYATLMRLCQVRNFKSFLYLCMSVTLLYFQIIALLGFQMRNQYSFCVSDDDCSATGQYCEPKIGICKDRDGNQNCLQNSDCAENFFCSTKMNQTCVLEAVACDSANGEYDSKCKANQFCWDGFCTNDYVMSKTLAVDQDPSYDDYYSWYSDWANGFRTCNDVSDCASTSLAADIQQNLTTYVFGCQSNWWFIDDDPTRCFAENSCPAQGGNSSCPQFQFCKVDYGSGWCEDFLGSSCIHNDNCSNPHSTSLKNTANYVCDWKTGNPTGICHYYGKVCSADNDCKSSGYKCNASITSYYTGSKYGWCYSAAEADNFCTDSKYLGIDKGALIFICCVIAISVAKDLREAIISEMKLRSLYKGNKEITSITHRKLFCLDPVDANTTRTRMWITFIGLFLLESVLFIRKYMFIPLVLAVTCSVIVDQPADQIILNGVAIFFVVDIDNLLYDFFHDKGEKDKMEEEGELEMNPREARYLKLISLISAAMLTMSLILVLTAKKRILTTFKTCADRNGLFRYGGLFVVLLLFIGYFLAELMVPILEIFWPTDSNKKSKKKSLKQSLDELSWQQLATSEGKLHVLSQSIALIYILAQGAAGAGIFIAIVKAYYYYYIGEKESTFSNQDQYGAQVETIYGQLRTEMEETITYGYF